MLSDETLSAYLEDDLAREEREQVSAILEVDSEARQRLENLESMRAMLAVVPLLGPSRDLWAEIEHEIARPRWWQLPTVQWGFGLAAMAAAALLVVLFADTGPTPRERAPTIAAADLDDMPVEALEQRVEDQIGEAKAIYASAIQMLEKRAERYLDELPDEARVDLKTSLFEVEQAIARVEGVIHDNPNDASAHTTLVALYDQKMRALSSTIDVAESLLGSQKVQD